MARTKDFDEAEVLSKAIELFWYKGYNATSMQDLVDALGISRSSLYDTYEDKHTLFIKALESYQKTATEKVQNIIDQHIPVKETIRKLLELIITELLGDKQQRGCFMVNAEVEVAPHDEEVNKLVCKSERDMEGTFYQVITKGQENGEISRERDAVALSRFIFNSVKGMRVTARSTTEKSVFDDIISLTISALD